MSKLRFWLKYDFQPKRWLLAWVNLMLYLTSTNDSRYQRAFSRSFGIKDILRGRVDPRSVTGITASTAVVSPQDLKELYHDYSKFYWYGISLQARILDRILCFQQRMDQPRLRGLPVLNIAYGHWLREPTYIRSSWVENLGSSNIRHGFHPESLVEKCPCQEAWDKRIRKNLQQFSKYLNAD